VVDLVRPAVVHRVDAVVRHRVERAARWRVVVVQVAVAVVGAELGLGAVVLPGDQDRVAVGRDLVAEGVGVALLPLECSARAGALARDVGPPSDRRQAGCAVCSLAYA
jgi:hypothetical protein